MPSCPAQKNKAQPIKQLARPKPGLQSSSPKSPSKRSSEVPRVQAGKSEKQERIERGRDFRERKMAPVLQSSQPWVEK